MNSVSRLIHRQPQYQPPPPPRDHELVFVVRDGCRESEEKMSDRSKQWLLIGGGAVFGSLSTVAVLKLFDRFYFLFPPPPAISCYFL
jgi:hypothetical protein